MTARFKPSTASKPHDHCLHIAGQPFGLMVSGDQVVATPQLCCHCGAHAVHYYGLEERGHGQYVTFTPAPKVATAGLLLPGGLAAGKPGRA